MKRIGYLGTAVAVVLMMAAPAAAQQPAGDGWRFTVSPYLMGAGISGTAGVKGLTTAIDASASDILSNLKFGAMGIVVARKGKWGVGGDAIYMALGATATTVPAKVDFKQSAYAFYGLRELCPVAELTFGARVNGLDGTIGFTGPLGLSVSRSKWWVDPLVGIRLHTNSARRVNATLYSEIGGFGVGSDLEWQIYPVVNVRVTKVMSLDLGYRWLSVDYKSGTGADAFVWDTLTQGPVLGFVFRF